MTLMQLQKKKTFFFFLCASRLGSWLSRADTRTVLIPVSMSATLQSSPALFTIFHQKMQQHSLCVFLLPYMHERPLTLLERDFDRAAPGPQQ